MDKRRSICFVGMDNYPVLNREYGDQYFGGESVQQTLLACAFRDFGLDVSMVVRDYGQPDGETVRGIRVWKTCREGAGLPVVRFVHPKATSTVVALRRARSDIYFQSCSGSLTGIVSAFCRFNKRAFVFRVASDADCVPGLPLIQYARDRALYRWGLRHADLVSAQSVHQAELLERSFGRQCKVIDMVVEIPDLSGQRRRDIDVLWVNNLRPLKRPHHVIQLARVLPQYRFVIVGGAVPGNEEFFHRLELEAAEVPNIELVGAVPFHLVTNYFLRARVFINTSEIEGFPNSILQAWAAGLPVISYFDPAGLNKSRQLGEVPNDLADMTASVKRYLEQAGLREETGERARRFVSGHYSPDIVAKCYLESLAEGSGRFQVT